MRTRAAAAAIGALALAGVAAWQGTRLLAAAPTPPATPRAPPPQTPAASQDGTDAETVTVTDDADTPIDAGATPMARRVAVVGLLNKRNGVTRDLTLHPGQAVRVGDVIVRLRACEETAPWEQQQLTGAFVQLDVQNAQQHWQRVFSGWLYKERPSLNVVLHPIYDVWAKSCAMSFPGVPSPSPSPAASGKAPGASASSAPKSPPPRRPAPSPSASPSAAI